SSPCVTVLQRLRRRAVSTPVPYTTLFRSQPWRTPWAPRALRLPPAWAPQPRAQRVRPPLQLPWPVPRPPFGRPRRPGALPVGARSEEHTSELQSRENLVCRLLLEKKNKLK